MAGFGKTFINLLGRTPRLGIKLSLPQAVLFKFGLSVDQAIFPYPHLLFNFHPPLIITGEFTE